MLGADTTPVGRDSRLALARLSEAPAFPPDFARRVLANVVSEEENDKLVLARVSLGEADAGIVYRSDTLGPGAPRVGVLEIPAPYNSGIPSWLRPLSASSSPPRPGRCWSGTAFSPAFPRPQLPPAVSLEGLTGVSAAGRSSLSFVAGVAVGSLAGLIGLGGAEFRLPVLKAVFHCPVHRAVTLNLAMSFLTLAAALPVRLRVGLEGLWEGAPLIGAMVVGAAAGASAGAALARRLCAARLERLVLVLLVRLGELLIGEAFVAWESPGVGGGLLVQGPLPLLLGAGIGVVSSLLGVAGGELIIPPSPSCSTST